MNNTVHVYVHVYPQVLPLLKQLNSEGNQPSHHSYMLLIILLILSQDECFNKSIHEKVCIYIVHVHVLKISIINYYYLLQCNISHQCT